MGWRDWLPSTWFEWSIIAAIVAILATMTVFVIVHNGDEDREHAACVQAGGVWHCEAGPSIVIMNGNVGTAIPIPECECRRGGR